MPSRRAIVRAIFALTCLAGLTLALPATSEAPSEYALKAEFIERFTRFIDWPSASSDEAFRIGIVGEDPFGVHLRRLANSRRIKGRPVEIRKIDQFEEIAEVDVVFISDLEESRLEEVLRATRARPILTIADTPGYAEEGVLINFYLDGDRIRFEINESAVTISGLQMDARLLKLARVVGRNGP